MSNIKNSFLCRFQLKTILFAPPKDLEYQRSSCVQVGSLVNLHAEEIPEVDSLSMIQEKKTTIVKKNHGIFLV